MFRSHFEPICKWNTCLQKEIKKVKQLRKRTNCESNKQENRTENYKFFRNTVYVQKPNILKSILKQRNYKNWMSNFKRLQSWNKA